MKTRPLGLKIWANGKRALRYTSRCPNNAVEDVSSGLTSPKSLEMLTAQTVERRLLQPPVNRTDSTLPCNYELLPSVHLAKWLKWRGFPFGKSPFVCLGRAGLLLYSGGHIISERPVRHQPVPAYSLLELLMTQGHQLLTRFLVDCRICLAKVPDELHGLWL